MLEKVPKLQTEMLNDVLYISVAITIEQSDLQFNLINMKPVLN